MNISKPSKNKLHFTGQHPARKLSPSLRDVLTSNSRVIPFRRSLAEICNGNHIAALLLSQSLYWTEHTTDPDGWFYKSQRDWHDEIGITRHQLDRARRVLKNNGFLREKLRNSPPVLHYQLDLIAIEHALQQLAEKRQIEGSNSRLTANHVVEQRHKKMPESADTYKEGKDDSGDEFRRIAFPLQELSRAERDRRQRLTDATRRNLRDFSTHPLEGWEESFTDRQRLAVESSGGGVPESSMLRILPDDTGEPPSP